MKLQETKGRYFLTVPKPLVRLLGWSKTQELIIIPGANKGELTVKEMPKQN